MSTKVSEQCFLNPLHAHTSTSFLPPQSFKPLPPAGNLQGSGGRKSPICSKADSTNTRVRPKGRSWLPCSAPSVKASQENWELLYPPLSLTLLLCLSGILSLHHASAFIRSGHAYMKQRDHCSTCSSGLYRHACRPEESHTSTLTVWSPPSSCTGALLRRILLCAPRISSAVLEELYAPGRVQGGLVQGEEPE